jgi:hypothetical protein
VRAARILQHIEPCEVAAGGSDKEPSISPVHHAMVVFVVHLFGVWRVMGSLNHSLLLFASYGGFAVHLHGVWRVMGSLNHSLLLFECYGGFVVHLFGVWRA